MTSIHHQLGLGIGSQALFAIQGEPAVYWPEGGKPRSVTVIIDREPPESLDTQPLRSRPTNAVVIKARNDEVEGISAAELNLGGDEIEFSLRIGKDTQRRPINAIVSQDGGILALDVR